MYVRFDLGRCDCIWEPGENMYVDYYQHMYPARLYAFHWREGRAGASWNLRPRRNDQVNLPTRP